MGDIVRFPTAEIIPDLDLDVEIDPPPMTKGLALALMRVIDLGIECYELEEDEQPLKDYYMQLQNEVMPEALDDDGE